MDIRSWLRCFPIRWALDELAKELAAPSPGARWRTFMIKDGPHWTFLTEYNEQLVLEIVAGPGPREGKIEVSFHAGPMQGRTYHVSSRHPAHDSVFRLTAAARAREADRERLN